MQKRGQFQISFGMIFSIIIIIAIVGIGAYVLKSFLATGSCASLGLTLDKLEDYIQTAWQSPIHQDTFPNEEYPATIPSGITSVCFGNLTQTPTQNARTQYQELQREFINSKERNVFLYPVKEACDTSLAGVKIDHFKTQNFFCVPVVKGSFSIRTEKQRFDSLVTISPS